MPPLRTVRPLGSSILPRLISSSSLLVSRRVPPSLWPCPPPLPCSSSLSSIPPPPRSFATMATISHTSDAGFPYKCILVVGGTSGIGKALAVRFIEKGAFVIVSGRRKEQLDEFVEKHGSDKSAGIQCDVSDESKIGGFVKDVTKRFPKLDCVFLNAGIQRGIKFNKPDTVDMEVFKQEVQVNYISQALLINEFLPFLLSAAKSRPVSFMITTSNLAIIPQVRCPGYSGTKAALHALVLCLRAQLEDVKNMRIIEILPPAVQTELHDEKHQPDIKDGHKIGMPLDEYVNTTWDGLSKGDESLLVETKGGSLGIQKFEDQRQGAFWKYWKMMKPDNWNE